MVIGYLGVVVFAYKVHRQQGHVLLAICDKSLLRAVLDKELGFHVSESFYGTEQCSEDDIIALVHDATMINAVGNKIVDVLVAKGLVEKENTTLIGNVAHAQIYML